jgi:DNA-binding transcriptional ArsR family regulator
MTPVMPAAEPDSAPLAADEALIAAFEQRVLTRDEPKPDPLRFSAASVQARLRQALRAALGQRDSRRLHTLTLMCYQFLTTPLLLSTDPALAAALGLSGSALTRTWRELRESGLVEQLHLGRGRGYRLSREGEDWLLAVVKGEADVK